MNHRSEVSERCAMMSHRRSRFFRLFFSFLLNEMCVCVMKNQRGIGYKSRRGRLKRVESLKTDELNVVIISAESANRARDDDFRMRVKVQGCCYIAH